MDSARARPVIDRLVDCVIHPGPARSVHLPEQATVPTGT